MASKNRKDTSSSKRQYLIYLIIVLLSGLTSQLCFSNDENSQFYNTVQISKDNPTIEFIYVPPYGSSENLVGRVRNADPDSFKVAVYILVGAGWWTKPTFANPLTPINYDSTWITDITTGGNDPYATKIHAFLLPLGVDPPLSAGSSSLPTSLDSISVADVDTIRNPRSIHFSGYEWWIKASIVKIGPGPNYFSDTPENVWVDDEDQLHLKITNRNGKWYCAEVILNESLGYGKYIFKVGSKIGQINENAVLGLFTWDSYAPDEHYREIDIEFSRWGVVNDPNAQYVVQPWNYTGNLKKWIQPTLLDSSTHSFEWRPDSISFLSVKGHETSAPYDSIIHSWKYTGQYIPTCGGENARINLWLFRGQPPTDNSEVEVIISNFRYDKSSTVVDEINGVEVTGYSLLQNYPNPFNFSTTVCFNIPKASNVTIKIYDILGHEIRTLVDSEFRSGNYTVIWDGRNYNQFLVPSGLYLIRMQANEFVNVKKIMLLR